MFKRILVPTDGSAISARACEYARDLAIEGNAQLVVVHAFIQPPPYLTYLGEEWLYREYESRIMRGRQVTCQVVNRLRKAGLDVIEHVLRGPPADAILRTASACQCDLIVMASRGRGKVMGLLLGSVSRSVLARAKIPVLIINARMGRDCNQGLNRSRYGRISIERQGHGRWT